MSVMIDAHRRSGTIKAAMRCARQMSILEG